MNWRVFCRWIYFHSGSTFKNIFLALLRGGAIASPPWTRRCWHVPHFDPTSTGHAACRVLASLSPLLSRLYQTAHDPCTATIAIAIVFTARCYASAVLAMGLCLCLSVSVTSRSSTKTAKRRITQTTPHDTPGTLVF